MIKNRDRTVNREIGKA